MSLIFWFFKKLFKSVLCPQAQNSALLLQKAHLHLLHQRGEVTRLQEVWWCVISVYMSLKHSNDYSYFKARPHSLLDVPGATTLEATESPDWRGDLATLQTHTCPPLEIPYRHLSFCIELTHMLTLSSLSKLCFARKPLFYFYIT